MIQGSVVPQFGYIEPWSMDTFRDQWGPGKVIYEPVIRGFAIVTALNTTELTSLLSSGNPDLLLFAATYSKLSTKQQKKVLGGLLVADDPETLCVSFPEDPSQNFAADNPETRCVVPWKHTAGNRGNILQRHGKMWKTLETCWKYPSNMLWVPEIQCRYLFFFDIPTEFRGFLQQRREPRNPLGLPK